MNILFITHHDNFQGSTRSLFSLLCGLQQYDVKPFVVVPQESAFTVALSSFEIPFKISPIPWWVTEKKLSLNKSIKVFNDLLSASKSIRELVGDRGVNMIYTNSSVTPLGRMIACQEHIPHIWHIRELAELHFSWHFIFPRFLSIAHIRSSDAIICVSKAVHSHYFQPGFTRAHVIYNGIAFKNEFENLLIDSKQNQKDGNYIFAIIGAITPRKGQQTAIKAIYELHKNGYGVRLIIAGGGKEDPIKQCKMLVESLGIESIVEFKGFVDQPGEIYRNTDCLLMCSEYEGLPRVVIEAMSTALPVIGKNSGGTPEIVEHDKTGLLYNTFEELVEAMRRMVQDPEMGRRLGLAGWQSARERFTIEDYAAKVYQVIQSVVGGSRH